MYQKYLSPDHSWWARNNPPYCKYYPTCSEYTKQAISKHGSLKGGLLGVKRIITCNPCSKGGLDFVEKKSDSQKKKK